MQLVTDRKNTERPGLVLAGRFDAFETDAFREAADALLAQGSSSISVDMSDVIFVDSSGLSELVRTMKHCREAGGELYINSPSDPVRVIFELTRLDAAFTIVDA
ncbi:MAG: STAS domain-containing protein [Actinomycetota bacterium]